MILVPLLLVALAVVAVVYLVRIYNGLVVLRENVRKAWANIDVLLTQRHDELPKLVETCKRYMAYERETLERVMQARAAVFQAQGRSDVAAVGAAEQQLRDGLGRLFAVAEQYPTVIQRRRNGVVIRAWRGASVCAAIPCDFPCVAHWYLSCGRGRSL